MQADRKACAGAATAGSTPRGRLTRARCTFFSRRKAECEARDYGDGRDEYTRQFDVDWGHVVAKQPFVRLISSSDRAALASDKQELERGVFHDVLLCSAYRRCCPHSVSWCSVGLCPAFHTSRSHTADSIFAVHSNWCSSANSRMQR
jgi:hypothetical protein